MRFQSRVPLSDSFQLVRAQAAIYSSGEDRNSSFASRSARLSSGMNAAAAGSSPSSEARNRQSSTPNTSTDRGMFRQLGRVGDRPWSSTA